MRIRVLEAMITGLMSMYSLLEVILMRKIGSMQKGIIQRLEFLSMQGYQRWVGYIRTTYMNLLQSKKEVLSNIGLLMILFRGFQKITCLEMLLGSHLLIQECL